MTRKIATLRGKDPLHFCKLGASAALFYIYSSCVQNHQVVFYRKGSLLLLITSSHELVKELYRD